MVYYCLKYSIHSSDIINVLKNVSSASFHLCDAVDRFADSGRGCSRRSRSEREWFKSRNCSRFGEKDSKYCIYPDYKLYPIMYFFMHFLEHICYWICKSSPFFIRWVRKAIAMLDFVVLQHFQCHKNTTITRIYFTALKKSPYIVFG